MTSEERVPIEEIVATVERMEARLGKDPLAQQLMSHYFELKPRFLADLRDPRDVALANASALVLVQQAIKGPTGTG